MLEATEDMLTIEPPPRASMPGSRLRIRRTIAPTLSSQANAQSASPAVEDVAGMDHAGAVEQHVERGVGGAMARAQRGDRGRVGHVQAQRFDIAVLLAQAGQAVRVDVGGQHPRALAGEGERGGVADALRCGGDQCALALQSHVMA